MSQRTEMRKTMLLRLDLTRPKARRTHWRRIGRFWIWRTIRSWWIRRQGYVRASSPKCRQNALVRQKQTNTQFYIALSSLSEKNDTSSQELWCLILLRPIRTDYRCSEWVVTTKSPILRKIYFIQFMIFQTKLLIR